MSTPRYVLPCQCGQTFEVTTGQSGTSVSCACGATVQVPTMREIRQLPQVTQTVVKKQGSAWGLRHGMLFTGLLVAVCGIGFAIYAYSKIPPPLSQQFVVDETFIMQELNSMTGTQLVFGVFEEIKKGGIDLPLRSTLPAQNERITRNYRNLMIAGGIVGLAGIGLFVAGIFIKK